MEPKVEIPKFNQELGEGARETSFPEHLLIEVDCANMFDWAVLESICKGAGVSVKEPNEVAKKLMETGAFATHFRIPGNTAQRMALRKSFVQQVLAPYQVHLRVCKVVS